MRDRSVSTVATGREDHIASCHAPSVSAACALPPLPVWLAAPPCSRVAACRPLHTFASITCHLRLGGERENRLQEERRKPHERKKMRKEKEVRGQGKKKEIGEKEINCLLFINCVLKIIVIKLLLGNWT
jgi:hypothetical protein